MRVLGIDPGDTTGAFLLEATPGESKPPYAMCRMEMIPLDRFLDWVDLLDSELWRCDWMVIEDFIARPEFSGGLWQELPTAKQIGALIYRARQLGVKVVLQQPSIKPKGYLLMNMRYVKGAKNMHIHDAAAHATYFVHEGIPHGTNTKPDIRRNK